MSWEDPRRSAIEAQIASLRLAMWCYEHKTVQFFCEHQHPKEEAPGPWT